MSSRKGGGGRASYDDEDYDDYDDHDDDEFSDDFDDGDEGYDAYDRGGGGATLSAKQRNKKKPPPAAPKKTTSKPTKPAAAPTEREAPKAASSASAAADASAAAAVAPRLAQQLSFAPPHLPASSLFPPPSTVPYSHPKELVAALAARTGKPSSEKTEKPEVHVVVLGHVDAGKSTLVGRLLADVGAVAPREASKVAEAARKAGKGSFSWAWLLDATDDERSRGVTVEVGKVRIATDRLHVTLLDAPGHSDFVPEAIGGVAVADAALLVVDGSRGGFEAGFDGSKNGPPSTPASEGSFSASSYSRFSGQTKEHAALARALGVRQIIVAVTKLDTLGYSRERFEEIRERLGSFLSSLGFDGDGGDGDGSNGRRRGLEAPVTWLPVSAPAGQNVSSPPEDPSLLSWWKRADREEGSRSFPTLLEALGALSAPTRAVGAPLRLAMSDVSGRPARSGQACALVSGKVEAGAVSAGMEVVAVPPGGVAGSGRVAGVIVRGGRGDGGDGDGSVAVAVAGDSCDVVVSGPLAEPGVLARGAVLCPATHPVSLASRFIARVRVLDGGSGGGGVGLGGGAATASAAASAFSSPGAAGIVLPGTSVTLHVGSDVRPATVMRLVSLLDPRTGRETRKRPRLVSSGQEALVEVAPEGQPVAVVAFGLSGPSPEAGGVEQSSQDPPSSLSRIALREAGKTIAVGVVVEVVE